MGIVDSTLNNYMPEMSAPKYTQDYINIEKIYKGLIVTKDKRYLKIFEIKPINFFMRSNMEQDDIVRDFAGWLKIAPLKMQIKVVSKATDVEGLIKRIEDRYIKDKDDDVQYLIKHYTDLVRYLGQGNTLTRKFYMIFEYEPQSERSRATEESDIAMIMQKSFEEMKGHFSQIGNLVVPLMSEDNDNEDWAIGEFLYKFFNPRTSAGENIDKPILFKDRVARVNADYNKVNGKQVIPDFTSYIASTGIEVPNSNEYLIIDGKYYCFLAIASNGYPTSSYAGWLSSLCSLECGESVDFFLQKENTRKMLSMIGNRIKLTSLKIEDRNETQSDYEQIENALDAGRYIKNCINNNEEDPFYMNFLITLTANTYEELMDRKEQYINNMLKYSIDIDELKRIQEDAYKSTFPLLSISPKVYQKTKRNIMTYGVAGSYPFTAYEMKDENGFVLGVNAYNNSLAILNPFDTSIYSNANMVLLGTSGAGKTYTEHVLALRLRELGTQCFILAPYKALEYKRACDNVGGSFIRISSDSNSHINIMDIRPIESKASQILQGDEAENVILVSEKTQAIITFITLLMPDLTNEEQQRLDTAIIKTYANYGITHDNNSLFIDPNDKSKGLKEMPILEDLYNELIKEGHNERVSEILSQFVTGSSQSFNKRTNVDLKNKYIVFDVEHLTGRLVPAGMFIVLDFLMGRIKEDVLERKMVFIDEGWKLMGQGANQKAAEYVQAIFKVIRGYNGGACIATQDIKDFFSLEDGKYGNAILSNSETKIVLNMKERELPFIKKELSLTREEMRSISKYQRGQCLVCANSNHVPVYVIGSDYLTKLVTTDPQQVAQVVAEMERNGGKLI